MTDNPELEGFKETDAQPHNRRWYDNKPLMAKGVECLEALPPDIQTVAAEGICAFVSKALKSGEMNMSFRSLGAEKVLSLYTSKNKRRYWDSNLAVHKSLNYLLILSGEDQQVIARELLELIRFIFDYFQTCQSIHIPADVRDVKQLTELYVSSGKEATEKLLILIKERLIKVAEHYGRPPSATQEVKVDEKEDTEIQDDSQGMRIRGGS